METFCDLLQMAEGRLRQARLPLGAEEDIYILAGERLAYLYNRGKWI
jgi:hypothetical protein